MPTLQRSRTRAEQGARLNAHSGHQRHLHPTEWGGGAGVWPRRQSGPATPPFPVSPSLAGQDPLHHFPGSTPLGPSNCVNPGANPPGPRGLKPLLREGGAAPPCLVYQMQWALLSRTLGLWGGGLQGPGVHHRPGTDPSHKPLRTDPHSPCTPYSCTHGEDQVT